MPPTDAEADAAREQLARLLASDLFRSSKRYPRLLKHIVEETLAGRAEHLKERTIGVEVFGRDPSYDTNLDPIVRTSAAQVRHRLAEYYAQSWHHREISIDLLPGSYVPQFRFPRRSLSPVPERAASGDPVAPWNGTALVPTERNPLKRGQSLRYLASAGLVLALGLVWLLSRLGASDAASQFWAPVWDKANSIVVCVPGKFPTPEGPIQTAGVFLPDALDAKRPFTISESLHFNTITWPDATTAYSVIGFIQAHGQQYRVRRERDSTFADLNAGPVVLVGGFNNEWLMRLAGHYRFTYQNDGNQGWISDSQNPSRKEWKVNWSAPYSTFDQDFGLVSRVRDSSTEHWVVVASGIASYGTIAAGTFLTTPKYLEEIAQKAPKGWERKNIQVLFTTKVFNGNAGPPQIIAVHVW